MSDEVERVQTRKVGTGGGREASRCRVSRKMLAAWYGGALLRNVAGCVGGDAEVVQWLAGGRGAHAGLRCWWRCLRRWIIV